MIEFQSDILLHITEVVLTLAKSLERTLIDRTGEFRACARLKHMRRVTHVAFKMIAYCDLAGDSKVVSQDQGAALLAGDRLVLKTIIYNDTPYML